MTERYLAVRVDASDMRPRIKPNETVIYDSQALPEPGDDIVIELRAGRFIVRELVSMDAQAYRLKSYSPASVSTLTLDKVTAAHPIIARCKSSFYDEIVGAAS
jgi:phage repressor protein C with HTH and peptisase S24 domain